MRKPYSTDLREKVVRMIEEGKRVEEVVKLMKIGRSNIYLWVKRKREEGTVEKRKEWRKGYGNKIADLEKFRRFVEKNEGESAVEMAKKWGKITAKTMRKWMHRLGYTRKKRATDTKKETKRSVKYIWIKSEQKIQLA